jgi:hypothetical protein
VVVQKAETCPACTVEDVASAATLATIELINDVEPGAEHAGDSLAAENLVLRRRVGGHARSLRRASLLVAGIGLVTAGAAGYFLQKDRTDVGYPLLGATGGLVASGAVMLGLSFRF